MPSVVPTRTQLVAPETEAIERDIAHLKLTGAPAPLQSGNSLDAYKRADLTPIIGTEFAHGAQLAEMLKAPNADELLKDLAILISQRGVVFFRDQEITPDEQKRLIQRLGELTGKPESSKLAIHPALAQGSNPLGDEVTLISSEGEQAYARTYAHLQSFHAVRWHIDNTFEPVPSDYTMLKVHTVPTINGSVTGGDTIWASGYEVYDRLSPSFAKYLETLEAIHESRQILNVAKDINNELQRVDRGSPANVGKAYEAIHPLIRTNPVTGWKSVFVSQPLTKRIIGVTKDESDFILKYLNDLVKLNHDLQVRFKWEKNSAALWDNRSVYHTKTVDYGDAKRAGIRVASVGEKPYLDPTSKSRREALA